MKNFKNPAWKEQVSKVIKQIQEQEIKFVRLQFTDINGMLKNIAVSSKNLESIFENGQSFDGSSITGYRPIEESDMVLFPDPSTFAVLPWRPKEKSSCRLICDIYTPQNKRFEGDPRYILERAVEKANKAGYNYICAPELEFFIVKESECGGLPTPIDLAGYFDFHPSDLTDDLRREIADTAEAFGIEIELSHHEVALGQNEIDFKYGEALVTADRAITMKMCGKVVAARAGYVTTYMPKPFQGINGSGMHVHQSLWNKDSTQNMFYSEDAKNGYLWSTGRTARRWPGEKIVQSVPCSSDPGPDTYKNHRHIMPWAAAATATKSTWTSQASALSDDRSAFAYAKRKILCW
jgi:glutamine synthetase